LTAVHRLPPRPPGSNPPRKGIRHAPHDPQRAAASIVGVLAGLLAAAVPANATPDAGPRGNDHSTIHMKAPGPRREVLSAQAYTNTSPPAMKAAGTQVRSEG
jgi:hypothetical protein